MCATVVHVQGPRMCFATKFYLRLMCLRAARRVKLSEHAPFTMFSPVVRARAAARFAMLCLVSLIVLRTLALSSPAQTPVCVAFLARHSEIRAARSLEMFRGLLLPFPASPRMLTFHFLYGRRSTADSRCRIVTGVSSYILL